MFRCRCGHSYARRQDLGKHITETWRRYPTHEEASKRGPREHAAIDPTLWDSPPPPARAVDTSRAAADEAQAFQGALQRQVFAAIQDRGEHGATRKELEAALHIKTQTACPRLRELEVMGLIGKTERKRDGCRVYVVTGRDG